MRAAKIEAGLEHSRVLVLCMSAQAFGSDWAQLEAGTFRFLDPLNQQCRFIPLRLDDTPIKRSLEQFLFINWLLEHCEPCWRLNSLMVGFCKWKQDLRYVDETIKT